MRKETIIKHIKAYDYVAALQIAGEMTEPFILKPFSPHCFRHTFVTRCKKNGVPYETIQPYVGHSEKEMTAYYNHEKQEIDVSTLNKISFLGVV